MKNLKSLNYISLTVCIITLMAIIFNSQQKLTSANPVTATGKQTYQPSAGQSMDISLPEAMSFAQENVPLHRLDVQEALRKELTVNTYLHSHTIQALQIAPRMFAIIEPILKEAGVPEDFKYLAVIESNLNPSAVSPAGAVGLWQFMEGTAKDFNLEVNKEVDERYHIEQSTRAAAAYLKKAYEKFGSWTTAAAAYNAGAFMVSQQMEIQKEKEYYNLLLGDETGRYVFRILALKQILNHPEQYNFNVKNIYPTEETKKVKVNGNIDSWADFAIENGITYKTLKRFNPWLRKNELRNPHRKVYEIDIPVKKELYK